MNIKPKVLKNQRDFNIITSKYKSDHHLKTELDREIYRLESAKNYEKLKPRNIILGETDEIIKVVAPKKEHKNSCNLSNPSKIDYEAQMKISKKKRYGIKYALEQYYINANPNIDNNKSRIIPSYQRYKHENERESCILNQGNRSKHLSKISLNNKKNPWEKLQNESKNLTQYLYDVENKRSFLEYKELMCKVLNSRQNKIKELGNFKESEEPSKKGIHFSPCIFNKKDNFNPIDKSKWFNGIKEANYCTSKNNNHLFSTQHGKARPLTARMKNRKIFDLFN